MTNKAPNPKSKQYDLLERTSKFGEAIIMFCRKVASDHISKPVLSQLVRAGTSIGANYMEADAAESKKDFIHKIAICRKEAKETMYWIRMISTIDPKTKVEGRILWKEAQEFVFIFSAIVTNTNSYKKNQI